MKMSSMHDTVEMKNNTNGTSQTQVRKLELELWDFRLANHLLIYHPPKGNSKPRNEKGC